VSVNKFCDYWLKKFWSIRKALPFATPSRSLKQKTVPLRADRQRPNSFPLAPLNQVIFCVRGVTTAPCGVPTSVFAQAPSSDTPALSHFRIKRSILRSAIRCSMNLPNHSCEMDPKKSRMSASSTQFTFFRMSPTQSASQRLMLASPGTEPIGEPQEVLFINLVEDRDHRVLNDFVLQGCYAQGSLSSVRFGNVGSLGRLRSIRSLVYSTV